MKVASVLLFAVMLVLPGSVQAQQAPPPQPPPQGPDTGGHGDKWYFVPPRELKHTFKEMVTFKSLDHGAMEWGSVSAYAWDMRTTNQWFERSPKAIEIGYFCHGSRDIKCIAGSWGAVEIAALVGSHVLLDHGKHHWWKDALAGAILGNQLRGHAQSAWRNEHLR